MAPAPESLARSALGVGVDPADSLAAGAVDGRVGSPHVFFASIEVLMDKFSFLRDELGIGSIVVGEVDDLAPVIERMV